MLDIYTLTWQSSAYERYETDMTERAERFLEDYKDVTIIEVFGGIDLTADVADSGFTVRCDQADAWILAHRLTALVHNKVTVQLAEIPDDRS